MLREFACIGLSRYTGQTAAGELIADEEHTAARRRLEESSVNGSPSA